VQRQARDAAELMASTVHGALLGGSSGASPGASPGVMIDQLFGRRARNVVIQRRAQAADPAVGAEPSPHQVDAAAALEVATPHIAPSDERSEPSEPDIFERFSWDRSDEGDGELAIPQEPDTAPAT
jgi:hypothetical protein